jgi:putative nucleotidyltransferase with HDIG domain/PAS domain S-box-containing protein
MAGDAPRRVSSGAEALPPAAFAALVRHASGVICLLDEDGRLRFVGASAERELDRRPGDEVGGAIEAWFAAEDRSRWRELWRQARGGGTSGPVRRHLRVLRRDGRAVWMSASLQDLRADPDVGLLFLNLRDVAALKRSEALLARQREELARSAAVRGRLMAMVEDALAHRSDGFEPRLLAHAVEMVPDADAGSLLVREEDGRLHYRAAVGYPVERLRTVSFALEELTAHLDGTTPQRVRYRLPAGDPRRATLERHGRARDLRATLAIPVELDGELRAVLNLDSLRAEGAFDAAARELATVFASHLALVLERLELERHAERRHRFQRLLARSQRLLLESPDLDRFLPAFARMLLDGDPAVVRVGVYRLERDDTIASDLYGPDDPELAARLAVQDLAPILDPSADTVLSRTLRTGQATYLPDVREEPGWQDLGDGVIRTALLVPVTVRGRVWGVFDLVSDRRDGFDAPLRELVRQVATGLSLALERDAARGDLEQRLDKLRAVVAANGSLRDAQDVEAAYGAALAALRRRVGARAAWALMPDADGALAPRHRDVAADAPERPSPEQAARARRAFEAGRTEVAGASEAAAWVATPVLGDGGAPVAVLAALRVGPEGFGDADVAFVEAIAHALSAALGRLGLLARAEREAEAYRALARFGAAIEEVNDPERLLELGVRELQHQLGLPFADYHRLEDGRWRLERAWGDPPQAMLEVLRTRDTPADRGLLGQAARLGEPRYLEDYAAWPSRLPEMTPYLRTVVALPVARRGRVTSVLAFHADRRQPIPSERITVARNFLRRLENALERADNLAEVESTREATLRALGLMLEHRDFETKGHTDRVVAMADRLAAAVGLPEPERLALRWGAYLHDVGKVAVPDAILLKPGRLDETEFEAIRRHPVVGAEITDDIGFLPAATRQVVRHHHERWDGGGYPDGLAGTAIPRLARMFSLVDVWDALRSARPYKPAWSVAAARAEIDASAATQFDPELAALFLAEIAPRS